ncbi:MAG TPA: MlaD family protein [Methylomirabilota bacterium]|nr:MlaD family protein [Methylomirabilota bacterium]
MPLQDLTPQLRTRLSRLERLVGWFVAVATFGFLAALAYYVYVVAERRGTFLRKLPYFTFVENAAGLRVGDKVKLMGFEAGEITRIEPQPPDDPFYNVFVAFVIREPYEGYLWTDSRAKVTSGDLLGGRVIEVSKGTNGIPTYVFHELREVALTEAAGWSDLKRFTFGQEVYADTNLVIAPGLPVTGERLARLRQLGSNTVLLVDRARPPGREPTGLWDDQHGRYRPPGQPNAGYFLLPSESPALAQRLDRVAGTVEAAVPGVLALTNQIHRVLTNTDALMTQAGGLLAQARPAVSNVTQITALLNQPRGALGEWLLPTNLNAGIERALNATEATLVAARTNVALVSSNLLVSLENLANLTSNLNAQVQDNGLILTELSDLVRNTDALVQGLKRHWLLKGAFTGASNTPIESIIKPMRGGGGP